mmetsp:Transcript_21355/g.27544  ORF Transcript_21355/g.27544 Transcript_21355/m.27544 type:complete len:137 (-) Transcript_21355:1018-1428(-)
MIVMCDLIETFPVEKHALLVLLDTASDLAKKCLFSNSRMFDSLSLRIGLSISCDSDLSGKSNRALPKLAPQFNMKNKLKEIASAEVSLTNASSNGQTIVYCKEWLKYACSFSWLPTFLVVFLALFQDAVSGLSKRR